jgi:two-component system, LytTR family, response regulator
MKVRAVIVDDEISVRETIHRMVELYCSHVEIVGEADGVRSGFDTIIRTQPDVVLLDIQLVDGTGFELLQQFSSYHFKIIFVTAHNDYALQALKCSALDYLLKPVDPDDLCAAFEKAKKTLQHDHLYTQLQTLLSNFSATPKEVKNLILKTAESIYVVQISDIIRCESMDNYTQFFLKDGKKLLVSKTLKEYDELLQSCRFFRVHQSHLINLNYLERYDKREGGTLVMKDKSSIPVALRKKDKLFQLFDSF